ncbi:universal stress protein [Massilia sp.]|uniref:universal stress protein n=1 Tax=Massilia sp. TaxID=1882437 RepID=UPI00391A9CF3
MSTRRDGGFGGVSGWTLVAAEWSDRTVQVARRAACLAQQRGERGLLVHFHHYGLKHLLRGMSAEACAQHQRERLTQLAQLVQRQTGFVFEVEAQRGSPRSGADLHKRFLQARLCVVEAHPAWSPGRHAPRFAPALAHGAAHPVLMVRRDAGHAYRRVLVLVDPAASVAETLAQVGGVAPGAEIVLLSALDRKGENRLRASGAGEDRIDAYVQQQREDALRRMDEPDGVVRIVEHGYAPTVLQYAERRLRPDLLVLPGERAPGLRRLFLRSLAAEALARSDCDILALPDRAAA